MAQWVADASHIRSLVPRSLDVAPLPHQRGCGNQLKEKSSAFTAIDFKRKE
jgi:hypothetical protein